MQSDMDLYTDTAAKLEDALVALEATVQKTQELSQLALVLEEKLINLPEETIQQLVTILQQYLDSR